MIFKTRINGIPCKCRVLQYEPYLPAPQWGERLDPPDEEYFEYELLDRKGYPAGWLEKYLTPEVDERLLNEYLAIRRQDIYYGKFQEAA